MSSSVAARITNVATHLPDEVLTNEQLAALFVDWPAEKILDKTGISQRRIAAPDETAADLAFGAARRLFDEQGVQRGEVDFLILCTQAPDHVLPTTACLLQDRLGLATSVGAFDINLGCSGFVYGLSVAAGLIATQAARSVLLLTADTYSKYINAGDKSVRTLFGDGAAATLIEAAESGAIGPFVFGTDGSGGKDLIVKAGAFRTPRSEQTRIEAADASGNIRSDDNLYMNGAGVLGFTLREVPRMFDALLRKSALTAEALDHVVMHQANKFMVDALQKKLKLPDAKVPRLYEEIGNTVSSTIPFVLADLIERDRLQRGQQLALLGFGVGLSWAGGRITW